MVINYSWQYTGVAPWLEIVNWCYNTFPGQDYLCWHETVYFEHEPDYVLFLLKWQ